MCVYVQFIIFVHAFIYSFHTENVKLTKKIIGIQ